MTKLNLAIALALMTLLSCSQPAEAPLEETSNEITEMKIENLLRDSLGLREGVEVIMSYIELPKGTTLPTHYHPGEEFVYILEGSGELSMKDQSTITLEAGDVIKVPLEKIHSFSTVEQAAKAVVFRVHEKGQPDRILIEDHD